MLLADQFGAKAGVRRLIEGDRCSPPRHLVLPVSTRARPHRHHHLGPLETYKSHHIADIGIAPFPGGLFRGEREVEIQKTQKMRRIHSHQGQSSPFLLGSDEPQGDSGLRTGRVSSTFSTGSGNNGGAEALVEQIAGEGGHDGGVVVRMGPNEHKIDIDQIESGLSRRPTGDGDPYD